MFRSSSIPLTQIKALGLGLIVAVAIGIIVKAKIESANAHRAEAFQAVRVQAPEGRPAPGQASVDLALKIFNIRVPDNALHPVFRKDLEDRGLSTKEAWAPKIRVEVGPSAFSSWAVLGSTLAHELEIHCLQNFFMINVMDSIGMNGTLMAEREAYLHELRNAGRFGLTSDNRDAIKSTMDYFYRLDREADAASLLARLSRSMTRVLIYQI